MVKRSKWNDRHRAKDPGIKVYERKLNRRDRYDGRHETIVEAQLAHDDLSLDRALDRVIGSLCREAGI